MIKIFEYLYKKYNFVPDLITMDFCRGPYSAIKNFFPNSRIYPCLFHFMQRVILHLPELKSKDIILKIEERDLLSNIRLICFINNETLDIFYE